MSAVLGVIETVQGGIDPQVYEGKQAVTDCIAGYNTIIDAYNVLQTDPSLMLSEVSHLYEITNQLATLLTVVNLQLQSAEVDVFVGDMTGIAIAIASYIGSE